MVLSAKRVAVTGATGHIGVVLVNRLTSMDVQVRVLGRSIPKIASVEYVPYDLTQPLSEQALKGVDAVVHLAAQTERGSSPNEYVETLALERLSKAATQAGARIVFASSQTARPDAPTGYGRAKWACEQTVLIRGGIVVRLGQVYGGAEKGLFGTICRLARTLPILPMFRPDPPIQPVHVDDASEALIRCALRKSIRSGIYCIAQPDPVGFSAFVRSLAQQRFGRLGFGIPVPFHILVALLILPGLPAILRSQGERLRSLATLQMMPTAESIENLGMKLRPLADGLARAGRGRRKALISEADIMLHYVLGDAPATSCLKRYVRSVEASCGGIALAFRPTFRLWPSLLSLVDQPAARRRKSTLEFWRRVDLATVVAESSPRHTSNFLTLNKQSRLGQVALFALCLITEGGRQMLQLILGPQLDRTIPYFESERL